MNASASAPDFDVRVEHSEAISWIVLDRPDRANALSSRMLAQFSAALASLADTGAPVVGIRANGPGFCAGMDLLEYGGVGPAAPEEDAARLNANVARWFAIWDHPKPVIAAVHGFCLGVGAQMCVFADITLVSDDVRIGQPGVPIGGGFISPTWVSLVGPKRAKEFAFLPGNSIDGASAVKWGWANPCVPAEQLVVVAEALAARIALIPPAVLTAKKRAINRAAEAAGFRTATSGIAEIDALLHLSPAVLAIRERMKRDGLKAVVDQYRGPSSAEIARAAWESRIPATVGKENG